MKTPRPVPTKAVWVAPAFCGFLSLSMLLLPSGAGAPAFYGFLPMCFVYVAMVQLGLTKRLAVLEQEASQRTDSAGARAAGRD